MYECQYESVSFGQFILDRKYTLLVIRLQPDKNTERLYQGSVKNLNSSLPVGKVAL